MELLLLNVDYVDADNTVDANNSGGANFDTHSRMRIGPRYSPVVRADMV